jgi:6-phosphogluconolactonase
MKVWYFVLLTTFSILGFSRAQSQEGKIYHLLIGTYTSGKSEGIYVYAFNSQSSNHYYAFRRL